jgi:hypothetical protein
VLKLSRNNSVTVYFVFYSVFHWSGDLKLLRGVIIISITEIDTIVEYSKCVAHIPSTGALKHYAT